MDIKDIKMSINLTEKNIYKHLTDLETILESEGLTIRSVNVCIYNYNMATHGDAEVKTLAMINNVKIEVGF